MSPDELSLPDLAARLAREEQANADLRAKLANMETGFAAQQALVQETLPFGQPGEVTPSPIQPVPPQESELETQLIGQKQAWSPAPAPTLSSPDREPESVQLTPASSVPGVFTRPGRRLFFTGMLILLVVLVLLTGDTLFIPRTLRAGLVPTPIRQATPSFTVTPGFTPEATSTLSTSANACIGSIGANPSNQPVQTATATPTGTITEFAIPVPPESASGGIVASSPEGITAGPDGNLWFTESISGRTTVPIDQIGRITPDGTITEFTLPTLNSVPKGITVGPDGNLWFTENGGNQIGRITPTGAITEFAIPLSDSEPYGITTGPDGNLWFTEDNGNQIGRITPTGAITEFALPTPNCSPQGITAGPDGNLWFTEAMGNQIGRITPAGTITEFVPPTSDSSPERIVAGPDGNLWFTELNGDRIGRITPTGKITEFATFYPEGITVGPDGNLWFTEAMGDRIGRITPAGAITEFTLSSSSAGPVEIAAGPDGNLWFTDMSTNKLGRIMLKK